MSVSPDLPPAATNPTSSKTPPWDPRRIWRWGLFCGPYWTSLMAGLNILRLGQKRLTIWPVLIVVVGIVLAMVDPFWWLYRTPTWVSYVYQSCLSFAAMGALWALELNAQKEAYDVQTQESRGARFKIPVILGILPGLQLWAYVILHPILLLTTPTATQVCEMFFLTDDPEMVRPYCTVNMYQTIDLLKKVHVFDRIQANGPDASSGPGSTFQLERENLIPGKPGRRRIDMKLYYVDPSDSTTSLFEGYFEVQHLDDTWRIDELFLTHMDHQPFPQGKVRFEELLKPLLEQQNEFPPDQQINQESVPADTSVAEFSTVADGSGVPILTRHLVPRRPDEIAALKAAIAPQPEVIYLPSAVVEKTIKQPEAQPTVAVSSKKVAHLNDGNFVKVVLIFTFFVLPAIWRFLFGPSTPTAKTVSGEADTPST